MKTLSYNSRFFKISVAILLVLLIITLSIQLLPVMIFILNIITNLLYPTLLAGALYYLLRPLRDFFDRHNVPRVATILGLYLLLSLVFFLLFVYIWPHISQQFSEFSQAPKEKIEAIQNKTLSFLDFFNLSFTTQDQLKKELTQHSINILKFGINNFTTTVTSIAHIASVIIITPFILFYLLKEDNKFLISISQFFPPNYEDYMKKIAHDVDLVLSFYVSGQIMVASVVALLIYAGYWIIGLQYVATLALFAFIFNMIPFTGPFISTVPALLIGLADSPWMGVKVVLVVIIVHLLDLNIISPRIVGQRLHIHPVTIILLLVGSLSLFGFLGLFLITPAYAVAKVVLYDLYEWKSGVMVV